MYKVILKNCGNIDHEQNPFRPLYGTKTGFKMCDTIADCQFEVIKYITIYDLGAGNFNGGQIFKNDKLIGQIGYNGKIIINKKIGGLEND